MKIAYYRDKQFIWLEGNFEKATFSRQIYLVVLSSLGHMYSSRQGTP